MLHDLIESVGSFGPFQWMMLSMVMTSIGVMGFSQLIMTFGGIVPDWWCITDNSTADFNISSINYQACSTNISDVCHRTYENYTRTVVSEFDIVCDQAWIKPTVTSIQMSGVLVGAFLGGYSGDRYGRKKTVYTALAFHLIFNIVIAFSINWQMFAAFRFFIGFTVGAFLVVVVYPMEFIGNNRRALAGSIPYWAIGACVLALASYLIHDWKYLHITCGVLTFPYLLGWFIVPESVRWLATKGKVKEAVAVIEKIARINGTTVPENAEAVLRKVAEREKDARQYTYLDIYRGKKLLKSSLCLQLIWASVSAIYYGISFGMSSFSGNFYLNFFIVNVLELPLAFPITYFLGRIGRRLMVALPLFMGVGVCIAVLIIQEVMDVSKSMLITGLSVAAQLLTSSSWVAMNILSNETYPTVIRYLGTGAANTAARIGGILAPFIFNLGSSRMIPYIIMGVLMIASGISALMLDETNKLALKDIIGTVVAKPKHYRDELAENKPAATSIKPIANGTPKLLKRNEHKNDKNIQLHFESEFTYM